MGHADNGIKFYLAVLREIFMPIPACCIEGKFYAKSTLLHSKGGLYASDVGRLPHVYDLATLQKLLDHINLTWVISVALTSSL